MPVLHDTKIVILSTPLCDLDQYRNDMGELAILVPKDVPYQIVENVDELSDLERIASSFTTTFEMPINHAARIILGNVQYRITKNTSIFRAILTVGDMVMVDGFLTVNETAERLVSNTVTYSIQIIGTHQIWKEYFRTHCLQDLDLGSVTWTKPILLDLMENNDIYQNGGSTIYPMLADFGRFHYERFGGTSGITIYDLRFVVYKAAIIRAAFAAAGYCVVSNFLDSEYYRKESLYALRPNFYDIDNVGGDNLRSDALVELSTDQLVSVPVSTLEAIMFDNIIYNNTGKYNNTNWRYYNNTPNSLDGLFVRLNLTICNIGSIDTITFSVRINMYNPSGGGVFSYIIPELNIDSIANPPLPLNDCVTYSGTIDYGQVLRDGLHNTGYVPSGFYLQIDIIYGFEPPTIIAGSAVEFLFGGKHFYENDFIPIAQVLSCDKTLYDILLDERKQYNLRFDTDQQNKIVYIEPEPSEYVQYESYQQPEKVVRGFNFDMLDVNGVWDITDLVDIGQTIRKQFNPQDNYNQIKFKFKDSSDSHPSYEPFKIEGNSLWSKTVQIGNSNTDKALEITLNTIEPTLNDFVPRASNQPEIDYRAIYIPIMWDSSPDTDGTPPDAGTNYEFRSLHVFGWITQFGTNPNGGLTSRTWNFENSGLFFTPTLAQCLPPDLLYQDTFIPFSKVINNIFGDNVFNFYTKDLVTTFYPDILNQQQNGIEINLDIRLTALGFKCLNIRQLVRIFSEKMPLIHLNNHYRITRVVMNFNDPKLATITLTPKLSC